MVWKWRSGLTLRVERQSRDGGKSVRNDLYGEDWVTLLRHPDRVNLVCAVSGSRRLYQRDHEQGRLSPVTLRPRLEPRELRELEPVSRSLTLDLSFPLRPFRGNYATGVISLFRLASIFDLSWPEEGWYLCRGFYDCFCNSAGGFLRKLASVGSKQIIVGSNFWIEIGEVDDFSEQ